ncbi:MAG TPA: RDD family protein [Kofleriaceae bacterium]
MPAPMSPLTLQNERAALTREIVTPEGVPLNFVLAGAGDRAAAFIVDTLIQVGVLLVIGLLLYAAGGGSDLIKPFIVILAFLILNFYFAFFEVRWQGQTPGKRAIGIRVIDSRGGQLETQAVLARNLVRELEVWTPLRFLVLNRMLWPDAPGWALVLAGLWTFVFMLLPLFNKDKLRVGDLVGGTRVVVQPKFVRVPDLVNEAAISMQMKAQAQPAYAFTDDQLGVYGIYELQVLEDVLRQDTTTMAYSENVMTVSDKIRQKIGYPGRVTDSTRFLKDFYVAQRAHLEQKVLFGQRKQDKFSKK